MERRSFFKGALGAVGVLLGMNTKEEGDISVPPTNTISFEGVLSRLRTTLTKLLG